jgi:hypothetical protein
MKILRALDRINHNSPPDKSWSCLPPPPLANINTQQHCKEEVSVWLVPSLQKSSSIATIFQLGSYVLSIGSLTTQIIVGSDGNLIVMPSTTVNSGCKEEVIVSFVPFFVAYLSRNFYITKLHYLDTITHNLLTYWIGHCTSPPFHNSNRKASTRRLVFDQFHFLHLFFWLLNNVFNYKLLYPSCHWIPCTDIPCHV